MAVGVAEAAHTMAVAGGRGRGCGHGCGRAHAPEGFVRDSQRCIPAEGVGFVGSSRAISASAQSPTPARRVTIPQSQEVINSSPGRPAPD